MNAESPFPRRATPYAAGGYVPPRVDPIPTPITVFEPLPVVLTEARLGRDRALGRLLVNAGLTFLTTWLLMLIVGALHNDVAPWLPPLGYWHTMLALLALRMVQVTPGALWTLTEQRKTLGGKR